MSKAKFSTKTKQAIYERDNGCCILCWINYPLVAHHAFYWDYANRWPNRNDIDQWVTICHQEHSEIHWGNKEKRKYCMDYLSS